MGHLSYLLDTHTYLWVALNNPKLSAKAKAAISSKDSKVYVSPVTAYEILNKYRIGRLPEYKALAENYLSVLNNSGLSELIINTKHFHYAGSFDWEHRDPFDRMLAAHAFIDDMILVTNDDVFDSLPWVNTLW